MACSEHWVAKAYMNKLHKSRLYFLQFESLFVQHICERPVSGLWCFLVFVIVFAISRWSTVWRLIRHVLVKLFRRHKTVAEHGTRIPSQVL